MRMFRALWCAMAALLLSSGSHAQTFGWSCQPKCIDAGVNWSGGRHYLFKGNQYVRYTGEDADDYYPRPIAGSWSGFPAAWSAGINAAVDWGNGKAYFFSGREYLRFDIAADKADGGYPRPIAGNWNGFAATWSSGIDAAVKWSAGKVYFFRGSEYLRFDVTTEKVDEGFPRPIAGNWPGFPHDWSSGIDAAVNWGDGTIYFFRGDRYVRYDVTPDGKFGYTGARSVPGNWTVFAEPPRVDLNETYVTVPVTARGLGGQVHGGPMILTFYRPKGAGPFPAVIYSHGRRPYNREFPMRRRESEIAEAWLRRGFSFFIATRLGYGGTGLDPDVEENGGCAKAQYEPGARAAVEQAVAAVTYARTLPFVDRNRIILAGNSTGGLAMMVAAGTPMPEGVLGAVNYAGGAGGGVLGVGHPCNEPDLRALMVKYGHTARLPMLWLYASDDAFWGPALPRLWYADFVKAGGKAEFQEIENGGHGHDVVSHPEVWGPAVDAFLARLGLRPAAARR
ncbi:hypothetical protein JQ557_04430 [Bradyrhizobium sp. U87765 SZCCT0131]|uniref:hemopexin repeat-containing protein n=1 Tax=unclassified Bradyrhizobium TaxID=2631580 RepID=UPI001BAD47AB|nr:MULTISPECIES: hemopexin repeat-containing protein [unclassified Bradyrhizobium]MBR1217225.1 hypothetical protein [Bradyrhizobium sp. U87765 SZCCT0131]MBR1259019.1 hypothetical protein [Bradyrhizobium sp. U87765 SZCCT0134]MBR1305160.1 hypothetical protein [Bradyrhizobium sp. U87765 SZCCT0110]MBR1320946.1 hypothetical protein [Bradyrhizobium sp. U87765 SZCCT0109]MBR1350400.1 hypothetical protein [Bradyrhizobium sp. U87765 SZCCT0048]